MSDGGSSRTSFTCASIRRAFETLALHRLGLDEFGSLAVSDVNPSSELARCRQCPKVLHNPAECALCCELPPEHRDGKRQGKS